MWRRGRWRSDRLRCVGRGVERHEPRLPAWACWGALRSDTGSCGLGRGTTTRRAEVTSKDPIRLGWAGQSVRVRRGDPANRIDPRAETSRRLTPLRRSSSEYGSLGRLDLALAYALWSLGFGRQEAGSFCCFCARRRKEPDRRTHMEQTPTRSRIDENQYGYVPGMPVQVNACFAGVEGGIAEQLSETMVPASGPAGLTDQFGQGPTGVATPWNVFLRGLPHRPLTG